MNHERSVEVDWQPIKTAPRDGRWFILWIATTDYEIALCRWTPESNCWRIKNLPGRAERIGNLFDFTHIKHLWMDLEPFFTKEAWLPQEDVA